jgi:hypothetical protein
VLIHLSTSPPICGSSNFSSVPLTVATIKRTRRQTTPHLASMALLVATAVHHPSKAMVSSLLLANMAHHPRDSMVLLPKASTVPHPPVDSTVSLHRVKVSTVLRLLVSTLRKVSTVSSDLLRVAPLRAVLRLREDIPVNSNMASRHQVVGTRITRLTVLFWAMDLESMRVLQWTWSLCGS